MASKLTDKMDDIIDRQKLIESRMDNLILMTEKQIEILGEILKVVENLPPPVERIEHEK